MFGQMYAKEISILASYVQLDVCGLSVADLKYKVENMIPSDVCFVLHGDWEKSAKPSTMFLDDGNRISEYHEMLKHLDYRCAFITLHPPLRSKVSFDSFIEVLKALPFAFSIENRSNSRFLMSTPEEIKAVYDAGLPVTIDVPQLFIGLGKDMEMLQQTLDMFPDVRELHLGNVLIKDGRPYVAQVKGVLNYKNLRLPKAEYMTVEVLGGAKAFESFLKTTGLISLIYVALLNILFKCSL